MPPWNWQPHGPNADNAPPEQGGQCGGPNTGIMRTTTRYTLLLALAMSGATTRAQTWSPLQPLPSGSRDGSICFAIDDRIYLGGGGGGHKDFFVYDPSTQEWTAQPDIPGCTTERAFATAFALNGKGYVCLGSDGAQFKQDLWEYDPIGEQWTERAPYPGTPRNTAFAFALNGKGYVCGGADNAFIYSDFYSYDPLENEWALVGALPEGPTAFGSAFTIGDYAYVMGGDHGTGETANVHRFDPATEEWAPMADHLGAPRQTAVAFALNGKGYFGCGQSAYTTPYADMYAYDPAENSWTAAGSFAGGVRCWAVAASAGDEAFMGTGWNFSTAFFNDWWSFSNAVGVEESSGTANGIRLFPVPADEQLNIQFPDDAVEMVITDATGRVIRTSRAVGKNAVVDVRELAPGIYQVVVALRNGTRVGSSFTRS